jgi:redox-sensitive bicupin YhaK (pirin superfamily)
MSKTRKVVKVFEARPTMEGAGVRLRRVFGSGEGPLFDPFLLLDHFGSDRKEDYVAGFPWHPHRGMETITYVLAGNVDHGDSLGNKGTIGPGDVQWMTAGSGIIHQEMPKGDEAERMGGFQLWANLPAANKLMTPRYREFSADTIPKVVLDSGAEVRVVAGVVGDQTGPVTDVVIEPQYLDITLPGGVRYAHPVEEGHKVFAYVFEGEVAFGDNVESQRSGERVASGRLALFSDSGEVVATAGKSQARYLLVSGRPIGEPIAWQGPIVMNTDEELRVAFEELRRGTFVK